MKILVVGDGHSELHEDAVYKAFLVLGHDAFRFTWQHYFNYKMSNIDRVLNKAQRKFMTGPIVNQLNSDLIETVENLKPELIFIYRGTHIYPQSLVEIKKLVPEASLISYNNDDPFSPKYPKWMWRHYIGSLKYCDKSFVYRTHNINDAYNAGAKNVDLLRSWYLPWKDKPTPLTEDDRLEFSSDVSFVGHFESDGRLEVCEALLSRGIDLKIFGPYKGLGKSGWHGHIKDSSPIKQQTPLRFLNGNEYVKALSGTKIALCFLSKLNRDTYTRRCFEIPACGAALFSEYSDDLGELYKEGQEAEFFRSQDELIEKVDFYLRNPSLLAILAERGRRRVIDDGHDVISRMRELICHLQ